MTQKVVLMGYGPKTATYAWKAREEFDANGTLTARYTLWPSSGRLNEAERAQLERDAKRVQNMHGRLYVVFSYATPIAWIVFDAKGEELSVHKVAQKFSVTTSKHQGRLY